MAGAPQFMIVDHADSLHEGVADGGADKIEAALFQGPGHGIRLGGRGRSLSHALPVVDLHLATDKTPEEGGKVDPLGLHGQIGTSISDNRLYLQAVTDNAAILPQPLHILSPETGNLLRIKVGKGPAITVAALENGEPGEPRLLTIQTEFLEQLATIGHGPPPLGIMVGDVLGILRYPRASALHLGNSWQSPSKWSFSPLLPAHCGVAAKSAYIPARARGILWRFHFRSVCTEPIARTKSCRNSMLRPFRD